MCWCKAIPICHHYIFTKRIRFLVMCVWCDVSIRIWLENTHIMYLTTLLITWYEVILFPYLDLWQQIAQMVIEHSAWIRKLGVRDPLRSRYFLSQKAQNFHKNIRSWVKNECCCRAQLTFRVPKISNIRRTLVGNGIVDHSDVVGASPVGAAPTTSSRLDIWLQGIRQRQAQDSPRIVLSVGIWCVLY